MNVLTFEAEYINFINELLPKLPQEIEYEFHEVENPIKILFEDKLILANRDWLNWDYPSSIEVKISEYSRRHFKNYDH